MTTASIAALFGALVLLAAVPGVSVLTVTARSAASGFTHGALVTLGIVASDVVFILLAVLGLSLLADTMGAVFAAVKYLGGAYVVWLGIGLWRSGTPQVSADRTVPPSLLSSFTAGLAITLADQKAILFYLGFLPAFVDLGAISATETLTIVGTAIAAVGGVKLAYAYAAGRVGTAVDGGAFRVLRRLAGGALIAVGALVLLQGWVGGD